jgi:hypothetical protein
LPACIISLPTTNPDLMGAENSDLRVNFYLHARLYKQLA